MLSIPVFTRGHETIVLDIRQLRFWILLERHDSECACPRCIYEQRKVINGWPAEYHDRWFGIGIDLPPKRGYGSWYTFRWSWNNARRYLRIVRSGK